MVQYNITLPLPAAASKLLVALGMYARNCSDAMTALRMCIGCEDQAHVRTVLLLDRLDAARAARGECGMHRTLTASVLSSSIVALGQRGFNINFPKTQHLLRLMLLAVPNASWCVRGCLRASVWERAQSECGSERRASASGTRATLQLAYDPSTLRPHPVPGISKWTRTRWSTCCFFG